MRGNFSELSLNICKKANKSILAITFTCNNIATLIKNLDPNKAHGHDMISICMLTLCGKPACKPILYETGFPTRSSLFNCRNPRGVKSLTRLTLRLSHLREHKLKHSFQDSLNPICTYGNDIQNFSSFSSLLSSFFQ